MYSETVEPRGNRKKLTVKFLVMLLIVATLIAIIDYLAFLPGILTMVVFLGAAILFYGEYRRNFIRYTYIFNEGTLYIDRRVGSFDAILEEVKREDVLSFEKVDAVPEGEKRNYCGESGEVYALTYEKGTFYFSPGRGLVGRLSE